LPLETLNVGLMMDMVVDKMVMVAVMMMMDDVVVVC
jgi:hypothetical protein